MVAINTSRCTAALGVGVMILSALAPLRAQDADGVYAALFQSVRQQEKPAEPEQRIAPALPRSSYLRPHLDQRTPRRPTHTVREKTREIRKIEASKPAPVEKPRAVARPASIPANPHLALMTDPTLQRGDIVIFPDGPRVFQGESGSRHRVSDFVPFAKVKGLSKGDRKYLMALRTGMNEAWAESTETTKVAQKSRDVETTGSVSPQRARR